MKRVLVLMLTGRSLDSDTSSPARTAVHPEGSRAGSGGRRNRRDVRLHARPSHDKRFRAVFDDHGDAVMSYFVRRVPREVVQDAVADVFVTVWNRLPDVPDDDATLPWILKIARGVLRDRCDTERRPGGFMTEEATNPSAPLSVIEAASVPELDRLCDSVNELDDDDRELLRLRAWDKLTTAGIARVTGLTERSVESHLSQISERLDATAEEAASGSPNDEMWIPPTPAHGAPP